MAMGLLSTQGALLRIKATERNLKQNLMKMEGLRKNLLVERPRLVPCLW
jgi:hypothetical protein